MAKHWDIEEDEFLLRHHGIGADFVANHDLGRPLGAGKKRLKKLIASGAAAEFASAMIALENYERLIGRGGCDYNLNYWNHCFVEWQSKKDF